MNDEYAFPRSANYPMSSADGMTLRDYFAAKAMQGITSDSSAAIDETGRKLSIPDDCDLIAKAAYLLADAMLEARK